MPTPNCSTARKTERLSAVSHCIDTRRAGLPARFRLRAPACAQSRSGIDAPPPTSCAGRHREFRSGTDACIRACGHRRDDARDADERIDDVRARDRMNLPATAKPTTRRSSRRCSRRPRRGRRTASGQKFFLRPFGRRSVSASVSVDAANAFPRCGNRHAARGAQHGGFRDAE